MASFKVLVLACVFFVLLFRVVQRRRRGKKITPKLGRQSKRDVPAVDPCLPDAPIFTGVRVVELATVQAAPSCAQALASMGAEVVKVEDLQGDYWRRFFLNYEPGRSHSSAFDAVNMNKGSVVLNLKEPAGRAALLRLLDQADVFLTNVRVEALERLQLDYKSIQKRFPGLVMAQLTAWGLHGPDRALPGYDLGAFWAYTGMAATVMDEGYHVLYPVGFGDASMGLDLTGSIALALRHRALTGQGQLINGSLLRAGLWVMSPLLAQSSQPVQESHFAAEVVPDYAAHYAAQCPRKQHPLRSCYKSQDGVTFALVEETGEEMCADQDAPSQPAADADAQTAPSTPRGRLAALCDRLQLSYTERYSGLSQLQRTLSHRFVQLPMSSIKSALAESDLPLIRAVDFSDLLDPNGPFMRDQDNRNLYTNCFSPTPFIPNVSQLVSLPFSFLSASPSTAHPSAAGLPGRQQSHAALQKGVCGRKPQYVERAPNLGEHTLHYLFKGWSHRPYEAELGFVPRALPTPSGQAKPVIGGPSGAAATAARRSRPRPQPAPTDQARGSSLWRAASRKEVKPVAKESSAAGGPPDQKQEAEAAPSDKKQEEKDKGLLEGVLVIELAAGRFGPLENDVALGAAGARFADLGADVILVTPTPSSSSSSSSSCSTSSSCSSSSSSSGASTGFACSYLYQQVHRKLGKINFTSFVFCDRKHGDLMGVWLVMACAKGKRSLEVNYCSQQGRQVLRTLLRARPPHSAAAAKAAGAAPAPSLFTTAFLPPPPPPLLPFTPVLLLTALSATQLRRMGLDFSNVHSINPQLVYCHCTAYGAIQERASRPEQPVFSPQPGENMMWAYELEEERMLGLEKALPLGAVYWLSSGLASALSLPPDLPCPAPRFLDAMLLSFPIFSAAAVGLFHLDRTGRADCFVNVCALAAGLWANTTSYAYASLDPLKLQIFRQPKDVFHARWPSINSNVFQTKDKAWVQLLCVDPAKHFLKLLRVLKPAKSAYLKAAVALVNSVFAGRNRNKLLASVPLFEVANTAFKDAIAKRTWAEWKRVFDSQDIWYCLVNTPQEALQSRQAHATHSFMQGPPGRFAEKLFVAAPVHFSRGLFPYGNRASPAPQPGAHTEEILNTLGDSE